jgi:ArsR family transcriptional regulator, arsenate/arsenite/antimonite-responsive transcriptional repressor
MENKMAKKECVKETCCSNIIDLPTEMEEIVCLNGGLKEIKKRVPKKEELVNESMTFKALSDPIRLQIIHALLISDLCPCILKEITDTTDSKLSYHLNILEEAGLISNSPRKKWRIYGLTEYGRSVIDNYSSLSK